MTNLEKIRTMSAEELSKTLDREKPCEVCAYYGKDCGRVSCTDGILEWLNEEADRGK